MNYLLLHEIFSLFFHCCSKNPEVFISFFRSSENIIAYNYRINKKQISHLSDSYKTILGYRTMRFLNNGILSKSVIHPDDLKLYEAFINSISPNRMINQRKNSSDEILCLKCRAKHVNGFWKYLVFFTIDYLNDQYKELNKIGIILDEHINQNFMVRDILNGHSPINSILTYSPQNRVDNKTIGPGISISNREREVLNLIGQGWIAKEIANHLKISTNTVISHRKNLINKFRVKNTPELIKAASRLMII